MIRIVSTVVGLAVSFSTAHATKDKSCESRLATFEEVEGTLDWDMMGLDDPSPLTLHDFTTVGDAKSPSLRSVEALGEGGPVIRGRPIQVARGYAWFLKRRRKNQGLFHGGGQFLWSDPAAGVIFDEVSGHALQTFAVVVDHNAEHRRPKPPEAMAAALGHQLRTALVGREDSDPRFVIRPPNWALIDRNRLMTAYVFTSILDDEDLAAEDELIYLDKMRAKPSYEEGLRELMKWERLVNYRPTGEAPRGRLIFDMVSHGFGPEWMESLEILDIVEDIKPLTTGQYDLTLFWDSRHLIEITRGHAVTRGYFEPNVRR